MSVHRTFLLLCGLALLPLWVRAQQREPAEPADAPAPKVKVERSATGQRVFRIMEGIVVEGRLQKPNAFYVLQRSSIDYDWEALNKSFLDRIIQATEKRPF